MKQTVARKQFFDFLSTSFVSQKKMSGSITARHLQIEVFKKNPIKLRVCGDPELRKFLLNKFSINEIDIGQDKRSITRLTTEFSITPKPFLSDGVERVKMAIVHSLEEEAFKIISVVFDQESGTEKLMMYKEA